MMPRVLRWQTGFVDAFSRNRLRRNISDVASPDWNCSADFFNFTRTRFIGDVAGETEARRVNFDMNALAELIPSALDSQAKVVQISKYPDGWYSKTFLVTLDDGGECVVKIPNPRSSRQRLTTESEVATSEFVSLGSARELEIDYV